MDVYEKLDQEWVDLMVEAKDLGIGIEELQEFLQNHGQFKRNVTYYALISKQEQSKVKQTGES
ncbi:DNA-binding anti-repressor SinI [Sediminibacillus sp. JSM 1682029]|uniref:anti-repressor SinI family protein n=1 Tax=Sediminibacillus sp. JSM 1682029 TaxID=3229857 RepID=UPI000410D1A9